MKHPRRKKSAKISEAVFRGKKSDYSFEVYPLTAEIKDTPAIFIFSRRKTDKLGKGHHVAVCIGETDSILTELKRHKRAKCVKQNAANVVCFLKENDKNTRDSILADITAARTFSCIRNAYVPTIKAKSDAKPKTTRPADSVTKRAAAKNSKPVIIAPAAKRATAKRTNSKAKPEPVRAVRPSASTAKKPKKAAAASRSGNSATRTRVQSGVDRNRRQHRLSKPEKPVARRAKGRAQVKSRTRKKAAA